MEKVISNLKEKSILHQEQVMNIKKYINDKYKGEEASRKAAIFADAVHNIVDESVKKFEKQHRLKIKAEVLKAAIAKDIFDINGYDVFEVCSLLPIDEDSSQVKEQFFNNLTDWLNENQEVEVTLEDTKALTSLIIDAAVLEVVNLLEESVLIEPQIKGLVHKESIESNSNPEFLEDSLDLGLAYEDNPDLEDHITDGRFMDTEGEIVDLSAADIEKAIIDSKNLYGDLDDIEVEDKIDKTLIRNEMNKRINRQTLNEVEEQDDIAKQVVDSITVQINDEEDVFDSMDFFSEEPEDNPWTETTLTRDNKVKTERLGGYELKPPEVGDGSSGVTFRIKLIIVIPAVLVTLALILFLIIGAISVSKRNAQLEEELKQMQEAGANGLAFITETIPTTVTTIDKSLDKEEQIEGVNYNEGSHLAEILKYKSIKPDLLKEYLENKNSYLSEDYYIDMFIQVAKDYNVNPLLLVAITGQEQNFVPRDHPDAELMKNNPFNVFISWKRYNTNFEDACKIAARTVLTSSEDRPIDYDPIKWINKTYAEDNDWHIGVSYFFNELTVTIVPDE